MEKTDDGVCVGCPHFLGDIEACGLRSEGIYLPLRAHIVDYCQSPRYRKCTVYTMHYQANGLEMTALEENEDEGSRRRHHRINEQRNVLLRTCDSLGAAMGDFVERSVTVDYSQAGMRVIIKKELPAGTSLLFDFGNDFLIPHLQGIAQLRWQRKRENAHHGIEAGLSFKDNFSRAVLELELGS